VRLRNLRLPGDATVIGVTSYCYSYNEMLSNISSLMIFLRFLSASVNTMSKLQFFYRAMLY